MKRILKNPFLRTYAALAVLNNALLWARSFASGYGRGVKVGEGQGLLWPLFLSKANVSAAYEIDTCATALGFIATKGDGSPAIAMSDDLVPRSLLTLISLRRPDGSWPSIQVGPDVGPQAEMEGIVNDTIFALHALIEGGFFEGRHSSLQPAFPDQLENLRDFQARMVWIERTVLWIEANRVGSGWYYTSTEFMVDKSSFSAAVGPTAGMVIVLDRLVAALSGGAGVNFLRPVSEMRDAAANWLRDIQHETGGFGRDARDTPRVAHTALALSALISAKAAVTLVDIQRAIDCLIKLSSKSQIRKLGPADCFDEYEQAVVSNEHSYRKRIIAHENPVEPLILRALSSSIDPRNGINLGFYRKSRISSRIFTVVEAMLARQAKDGESRGGFVSRRSLESERYPIYWVYYSVSTIIQVRNLISSGVISLKRNIAGSLSVRMAVVLLACVIPLMLGQNFQAVLVGFVAGVAVNIVSIPLTRD